MATTVYVPRDERWGELGQALGQGIMVAAEKRKQEAEQKKLEAILKAIGESPDRDSALNVVASTAGSIKPEQVALAMRFADELQPPDDKSLVEFKTYHKDTGAEQSAWVPRGQVGQLKDPNFVSQITGLDPESFTMMKPPKIMEYVDPVSGDTVGTFVPGSPLTKGLITAADFNRDKQLRQEKAAQDREERIAKSQKESDADRDRAYGLSEKKFEEQVRHNRQTESQRAASDTEDKNLKRISTEQVRLREALDREALSQGARRLADGTLDFSFMSAPRRQIYFDSLDEGNRMLESGEAKIHGQALRAVHKKFGGKGEAPSSIKEAPAKPAAQGRPKGSKVDPTIYPGKTKDGKPMKARKILDPTGKHIGWEPVK